MIDPELDQGTIYMCGIDNHHIKGLKIEGLPIPLQQGDNDASSLLQALVVISKNSLGDLLSS